MARRCLRLANGRFRAKNIRRKVALMGMSRMRASVFVTFVIAPRRGAAEPPMGAAAMYVAARPAAASMALLAKDGVCHQHVPAPAPTRCAKLPHATSIWLVVRGSVRTPRYYPKYAL